MRIAIITWFSYENYGTKLQAIALQKYLRNLGYYVELLNFEPPQIVLNSIKKETFLEKVCKQPYKYKERWILQKHKSDIEEKHKKMDKIIQKECVLSDKICTKKDYIDICNKFDLLICGSDQIWNPNLYHKYYFADFADIITPIISYAPSFGVNTVRKEVIEDLKHSLKRFQFITVREKQGAKIVEELIGKNPPVVMDPTFLLDSVEWKSLTSKKYKEKPYVLCYFLSDNKKHWEAVNRFTKKYNLDLYVIPQHYYSYIQKGEIFCKAGVEDFLDLISDASYVLTDSFHGTVFSLIFNKQFYTFERFKDDPFSSQNSRIINLLDSLSLMKRLNIFNSVEIKEQKMIDYNFVNKKLNQIINESKDILNKGLQYGKK